MLESHSPILEEVIEIRSRDRAESLARDLARDLARNTSRKIILRILEHRFGTQARLIGDKLTLIEDESRLEELAELAGTCTDLETFQAQLAP